MEREYYSGRNNLLPSPHYMVTDLRAHLKDRRSVKEMETELKGLQFITHKMREQILDSAEQIADNYEQLQQEIRTREKVFSDNWHQLASALEVEENNTQTLKNAVLQLNVKTFGLSLENEWSRKKVQSLEKELEQKSRDLAELEEEWDQRSLALKETCKMDCLIKESVSREFVSLQRSQEHLKTETRKCLWEAEKQMRASFDKVSVAMKLWAEKFESEQKSLEMKLKSSEHGKQLAEDTIDQLRKEVEKTKADKQRLEKELNDKLREKTDESEQLGKCLHQARTSLQMYQNIYGDETAEKLTLVDRCSLLSKTLKRISQVVLANSYPIVEGPNFDALGGTKGSPFVFLLTDGHSKMPPDFEFSDSLVASLEQVLHEKNQQLHAMKALVSQNQMDYSALQRQMEEEKSVTSYLEKEASCLKTCVDESNSKYKELQVKAAKMKKALNQLMREKTTLKEANVKLSEKQAVVQKQLSEAKTQIQSLQFQKTQAHTLAENLTTELHLAKKNMEIVSVQASSSVMELKQLKDHSMLKDITIAKLTDKTQRNMMYRDRENFQKYNRIGCVDPDIPLDAQLLFYD